MEKENWQQIDGYEWYLISDHGRVRSLPRELAGRDGSVRLKKEKILTPQVNTWGFHYVKLYRNGRATSLCVHALVAKAFLQEPSAKMILQHISGNKADNSAANLQWANHTGRKNLQISCGIARAVVRVSPSGMEEKTYTSLRRAGRENNINPSHIARVCKNMRGFRHAGGYIWRYSANLL